MRAARKTLATLLAAVALAGALASCSSDADVVAENLSRDAENFEIQRQIVFYNAITDTYIAQVTGLCSVETDGDRKMFAVCKVGPDQYIKNYLGLSDNVSWFALQTSPTRTSDTRYEVNFKPSSVIPDFRVR